MNRGPEEAGVTTQKPFKLFGTAGQARFLVMEVRQGSRFHQSPERHGENLADRVKTLDQREQIHIGGELAILDVKQLCFKFGHTAEAPLEIHQFGNHFLLDHISRQVAGGIGIVEELVFPRVLTRQQGAARGEAVGFRVG